MTTNPSLMANNYDQVRQDIINILPKKDWDDGSIGPILVRLAWHASGTYGKDGIGGSSGATMRYEVEGNDPANAGLQHARDFLEPIKKKYSWLSYSDLWTLGGAVAIEAMGGPKIPWQPGRSDHDNGDKGPKPGRLPDASKGADHIREIFYRMGFNDREIVALCGAHSLGRAHKDRSGFDGPWTYTPTKFTNQFFVLLKKMEWEKRTWDGPEQFADKKSKNLMMLASDMALLSDPEFKKYVDLYAENKQAFFDDFASAFSKLLDLGVQRAKM